jgi:hypothetical protein
MRNTYDTQNAALAQLRAALAACEAAGLPVLAQSGESAYLLDGVGEATADGEPVVVLWLDEGRWVSLDDCEE